MNSIVSKSENYILHAWQDNKVRLNVTQNEGGVKVARFTLIDNSGAIDLSYATSITFNGIKSNGEGCCVNCQVSDAENGIIELTEQTGITDVGGNVKGLIEVVCPNGNVKFNGITLYVKPNDAQNLIEVSEAFSALTDALNKLAILTPEGTVLLDTEVTENGVNAIQNKAVYAVLKDKADKATTLAGYGIDDAYNKAQTDTKLSLKINTNKIATAITASMDNTKLPNAGAIKAYLDNYYYGIDDLYDMEQVDIFLNQKADVKGNANILKIPDFTETKNGVTLTAGKNHITINGKTTANSTFRIILASPYLPINGTYTFSAQNADNNAHGSVTLYSGSSGSSNITSAIAFEDESSTTFTANNTIRQIWIWLPKDTNFINQQFDLQLEEGEVKTIFNLPITLDEDLQSGCISQRHLNDTLRNKIFGDKRVLSKLISDAGFAGLIKSYCCIGDSLTEGFFDITNGAQRDFEPSDFCSYPQQLKRITGANVLNYGISGSTAKPSDNSRSWLKQATAKGWLTSEDKSVGYIIALGVNDLILYDEFSGDVTTDINSADYTQNAKTSVGGYAAIIQKIKSLQPDAKIFCVTLPNDRGVTEVRTATNEKIKAIANLFDCYVIDLQNEWFTEAEKEDFCAKYRNGGHWNAMGYNQLAKACVTYIDYIVSNNSNDFRNIQFVGTEMQYNS